MKEKYQEIEEALDIETKIVQVEPVEIKKPEMILDYIGSDKEGFFIYWLRSRDFIDVNTT